jgi:CheY-like chemotaxis protein
MDALTPRFHAGDERQERPLVLILDEDETIRDLYGHWFSLHGFDVACAIGLEAVAWTLRRERPQLILTDLRVRDLTLHQLIARLQCDAATRCIPVIVITTSCDERTIKDAQAAGVVAVLPKLADFGRLEVWVRALCE